MLVWEVNKTIYNWIGLVQLLIQLRLAFHKTEVFNLTSFCSYKKSWQWNVFCKWSFLVLKTVFAFSFVGLKNFMGLKFLIAQTSLVKVIVYHYISTHVFV